MVLFERSSGCKVHRDPLSNKCKFLPIGKWRNKIKQEEIPVNYFMITDSLDFLGVSLCSTYLQTKKINGEKLIEKLRKTVNAWKAGRYMALSMRAHSVNTYALSKIYHKYSVIEPRKGDIDKINSIVKSYIYQDLIYKPQELALWRPIQVGGLGLFNVEVRAKALFINNF